MKVTGVSLETFNLTMQWFVCSVGKFTPSQCRSKSTELTALIELAIFAETIGLPLGNKSAWFMSTLKTTLIKHRNALNGSHIQLAFKNLTPNHKVRKLLVQASLRPYAEFHHAGEDLNCSDDDDDSNMNPAQRAAYRRSRFCFEKEFNSLEDYQAELLREFHRVWWNRNSFNHRYSSRHSCRITNLTDPLTGEIFQV